MKTTISTLGAICGTRRGMPAAIAMGFLWVLMAAPAGQAQTDALKFENNFFVTGDYVVAGWRGKTVDPNRAGYATGTITIPDPRQAPPTLPVPQPGVVTQVPTGADVVAAYLYWTTVEKNQSALAGQQAYFRGYGIMGTPIDTSAPVSWSSGGCSGSSNGNGTTVMQVYRADVRPYLPADSTGVVQPNTSYTVEFADSGSNGNTAPFTLGATIVIIYRVMGANLPLTAVVLYDGAFAPNNTMSTMNQTLQGFYQPAAASALAKMTEIVGNGQPNKIESAYFNGSTLNPLYPISTAAFPGIYNGSWDNPTWNVSSYLNRPPGDNVDATSVVPQSNNSGCVSWGAIVFSTPVVDSDGDGLLDYWEDPPGPSNPVNQNGSSPGYVDVGTGQFVALPGANPNQKDMFVQVDAMCSGNVSYNSTLGESTCDTSDGGASLLPPGDPTDPTTALGKVAAAFAANGHDIHVHYDVRNAIPETTCTDTDTTGSCLNPVYTPYPNQAGVIGWKAGFSFLKNQPLNINPATGETYTESECEQNATTCVRRFQHGRKDSYHYVIFGNALGVPKWNFMSGTLTSVVEAGNTVTFTTSTANGLIPDPSDMGLPNGRVTVSDAISNPYLNGTFLVQSVSGNSFTINLTCPASGCPSIPAYSLSSDPNLAVASGLADSTSGASDVGGEDSAITLGLWGGDGQSENVQAGTLMHEIGHTLGLTHGGLYYDTPGSYVPTAGANCKPNYQSVMSYLFQVDLLDGIVSGSPTSGLLDYSEQSLSTLNESGLTGPGVTTGSSTNTAYLTTKWFSSSPYAGVGTPATVHCDGSPISPSDPAMYRLDAPVPTPTTSSSTIPIAWASSMNPDINFNGNHTETLRGYNDWAHVDLQQLGAAGSLSTEGFGGGGFALGGGGFALGGGGFALGGGGFALGGGGFALGGGGFALGQGHGEVDLKTANSVTRPPRNLKATVVSSPSAVHLTWDPPTFGQIAFYNVYRSTDGGTPAQLSSPGSIILPATTSNPFVDSKISCGHSYTYFVTASLAGTITALKPLGQESVPSNTQTVIKCVVQ
jgi:hypothetical protein